MSIEELEKEALALDAAERARLAEKLLASLEDLSETEWLELWTEEIRRREEEIDSGSVATLSAAEVFESVKRRLR